MKLCHGAGPQLTLSIVTALLLTACAGKDRSPSTDRYDGSEVITAGRGIGTDVRPVLFNGQVVYRSNGKLLPRRDVTFKRLRRTDSNPYVIDIQVDENGRFESELPLITTVAGRRRLDWSTIVIIESPGCSSVRLEVDDDWRPRIIELECDIR